MKLGIQGRKGSYFTFVFTMCISEKKDLMYNVTNTICQIYYNKKLLSHNLLKLIYAQILPDKKGKIFLSLTTNLK